AARLRRLGVRPEVAVAVCLERSPELAIAVLGALKAGGTYFPLDPAHPADRLAFLLEDAAPRVLLTTRALSGLLPRRPGTCVVCLDDAAQRDGPAPEHRTGTDVLPGHPAYLIYTSGTTGRPKGVLIPHRAAVNHTAAVAEAYALQAGDRVLQFAAAT